MTTDTKQNPAGERVEGPAKRWFNWHRVTKAYTAAETNVRRSVGELFHGRPWPSKDIAETKLDEFKRLFPTHVLNTGKAEYLGAFPEGQRP